MATVKGKALYAFVNKPSQFGDYSVDLVVDDKSAKTLTQAGLKGKSAAEKVLPGGETADKYGPWVFKFKQKVEGKQGTLPPPVVVDTAGKPVTALIGNGSEVIVQYRVGGWSFNNRKGVAGYLQAIQVTNLIPYEKKLEFEFEADDTHDEGELVLNNPGSGLFEDEDAA